MKIKRKSKNSGNRNKKNGEYCFFCKRFFCTEYHYPRHRLVCSGFLPQWDWLYFLMREVKPSDSCDRFVKRDFFKNKTR